MGSLLGLVHPPPPSIIDEEALSELNRLREQMQQVRSRMDALSSTREAGPRKKRPLSEAKDRDLKRIKTEMAAFNPHMEEVIDLTGN
ncbi:hypothetical protein ONZ45_g5557 [Pleurotus djamor]|nr:hypothetical protein ONZ45_g5557 [Pleurotus djamor]